jgi:CheY-like chemotaxis protein
VRQAEAPDVILADYHLDRDDGIGVIRRLRALHGADIPAVLVTADRSTEVRQKAAALDVVILNKPVKPAALRAVLRRCRKMSPAAE